MIWVLSVLLFVHVLGAVFWFGSGLMLQIVFIPSLSNMPYEGQHPWLQALNANYSRIIGPIGGLTILFGILRGAFAGVFGSLNTPYGITFVVSFVLAIPVIIVGARFIGPTAEKMAKAANRDEVLALAKQIARYGRIESGGMVVMLALMVAMHAGY
jgi:putative copper export protein